MIDKKMYHKANESTLEPFRTGFINMKTGPARKVKAIESEAKTETKTKKAKKSRSTRRVSRRKAAS